MRHLILSFIKTIVYPNTIKKIYSDNSYIWDPSTPNNVTENIILPENITEIPENIFYNFSKLKSITIPNSVTTIGENAFRDCTGLTSITIPDSVTTIEYAAFNGCTGLTSITIPDSVTSIGNDAFSYCARLTSITIPNSVTIIGDCAFWNCTRLTKIDVQEANNNYSSTDGILYNKDKTKLITYPIGKESLSFSIPNSVTTIEYAAFNGCTGLTSITIPNSVTSIGYNAFYNCTSLTSITIPNSVTTIGNVAFGHWTSSQTINCRASSKPSGWSEGWNRYDWYSSNYKDTNWGYTGE